MKATTHLLERTSPKGYGTKFIGRCLLCGKMNLPGLAATEYCDNPRSVSVETAVITAVAGPEGV